MRLQPFYQAAKLKVKQGLSAAGQMPGVFEHIKIAWQLKSEYVETEYLDTMFPEIARFDSRFSYSIMTVSLAVRPKVSGAYISSAFVGGTI